jgi:hypothetical protein
MLLCTVALHTVQSRALPVMLHSLHAPEAWGALNQGIDSLSRAGLRLVNVFKHNGLHTLRSES